MNVEISIKIPVGQGVSISQNATTGPQPERELRPPEPMPQVVAEDVPPPSLEQLGFAPTMETDRVPTGMEPPSLVELGLVELDPLTGIEEVGPPSLNMLEGHGTPVASVQELEPPALEELIPAEPSEFDDWAPPPVETLESPLPSED